MKLKYSFDMVDLQNEIIAIPVGDKAEQLRGVVKLNQSGKEILELLKEEVTEEQIIDILANKYEDDRNTLSQYLHSTLETLREIGLID